MAALLCCTSLSAACATSSKSKDVAANYTPPGQTDVRVESLVIKGLDDVESLESSELAAGLAMQPDPGWRTWSGIAWIPFLGAQPSYYNEVEWTRDKDRALYYCKARGYFNPKIAQSKNTKRDEPKKIHLTLNISPGAPTKIASYKVHGLDGLELGRAGRGGGGGGNATLKVGEIFTQASYLAAKEQLYRRLRQNSYAYARVQGRVVVKKNTNEAHISFFVDPGPKAYINGVILNGLKEVEQSYVVDAITFKRGQPFSDSALSETQESIYDLGVFSLVTVQPTFELQANDEVEGSAELEARARQAKLDAAANAGARERASAGAEIGPLGISEAIGAAQLEAMARKDLDPKVNVVVQLKEAKPLSVRVGAGFSIDSTRQDVHLQANWSSRNLFGTLIKLEHLNTIGYAVTPGLLGLALESDTSDGFISQLNEQIGNHGVIFNSELELSKPQFIERGLTLFSRGALEREVQLGYIGLAPSLSVGLRRRFFENVQAELSYNVLYYRYQDLSTDFASQLINQELIRANDDSPSQLLETFEQRLIWDLRNNALNPSRGFKLELSLQEASSYLIGGQFDYIKPTISAEGYLPWQLFGARWVSAARAKLGTIYNLSNGEDSRGIPVQSRFFAGGRGSMRSFGSRFLSPFTENLSNRPADQFDPVPIGGTTLAEWSVEQRLMLSRNLLSLGDLWGGAFIDSATVLNEQLWFDSSGNDLAVADTSRVAQTMLYGAGVGLWWLTPVGPLRADFAYTLSPLSKNPNFDDPQVQQKILSYNFYLGVGHSF